MLTIYTGNALGIVPTLEKNSVHCSVTSPPYYSLRKYAGDQQCDWPEVEYAPMPGLPPIRAEAMTCALGHEPTLEAYIGHLVAIYREVYRVLRDDGVAWVVIGDSYAMSSMRGKNSAFGGYVGAHKHYKQGSVHLGRRQIPIGLRQGDLMMVPHRLALALQGDGWVVRNDVVWAKKAPMPESVAGWRWQRHRIKAKKSKRVTPDVYTGIATSPQSQVRGPARNYDVPQTGNWTDCPGCEKCEPNGGYVLRKGSWRHTRAHEVVFQLTKQMQYWSDQEAVREAMAPESAARYNYSFGGQKNKSLRETDKPTAVIGDLTPLAGRNPRSVLTPKPEPFPGSHFAVYPTSLIEPLIKATCPTKCCPVCGMGWSPAVEKKGNPSKWAADSDTRNFPDGRTANPQSSKSLHRNRGGVYYEGNILGYRPSCECGREDHVPGIVFDLFMGSGRTAVVAIRLGLHFYGCDISREYVDMAEEEIARAYLENSQVEMPL